MQEEATVDQNKNTPIIVGVIVLVALIIIAWFAFKGGKPDADTTNTTEFDVTEQQVVSHQATPEPIPEVQPEPVAPKEMPELEVVEAPIKPRTDEETKPTKPQLPSLQNSTPAVISTLSDNKVNTRPIRSENVVRDFVAFIDNLPAGEIARESAVINGPAARLAVQEFEGKVYLDPRSYKRYDAIVDWFVQMDTKGLVAAFNQFEPLFDEAYAEISRPDAAFRERLAHAVRVINATPKPRGLIELNADKIMYTYADEKLESLPSVQRQMIRMGPDNMARVQKKLNELLRAIDG